MTSLIALVAVAVAILMGIGVARRLR